MKMYIILLLIVYTDPLASLKNSNAKRILFLKHAKTTRIITSVMESVIIIPSQPYSLVVIKRCVENIRKAPIHPIVTNIDKYSIDTIKYLMRNIMAKMMTIERKSMSRIPAYES